MDYYVIFFKSLEKKDALLFQKCLESQYWGKCTNENKIFEYCMHYLHPKFNLTFSHLERESLPKISKDEAFVRSKIMDIIFSNWKCRDSSFCILNNRLLEIIEDFELFLMMQKKGDKAKIERGIFWCRNVLSEEKSIKKEEKRKILENKFTELQQLIDKQAKSELQAIWDFELNRIIYAYNAHYRSVSDENSHNFFIVLNKMLLLLSSKHFITQITSRKKVPENINDFAQFIYKRISDQRKATYPAIIRIYDYLLAYYLNVKDFNFSQFTNFLLSEMLKFDKEEQANLIRISYNIIFAEYKNGKATINDLFLICEKMVNEGFLFSTNLITDKQLFPLIDILEDYLFHTNNLAFYKVNILKVKDLVGKIKDNIGNDLDGFLEYYVATYLRMWENDRALNALWHRWNRFDVFSDARMDVRRILIGIKLDYKRNCDRVMDLLNSLDLNEFPNLKYFLDYMPKLVELNQNSNKLDLENLEIEIREKPYFLYRAYLLFQIKTLRERA